MSAGVLGGKSESSITAHPAGWLETMSFHELSGDEESAFDAEVQRITKEGFRIVDKHLVIDPAEAPPAWGWILYRETTSGERKRI